tara:strand:- start:535 stop:891 length:357 start_codon:yes stop_codon:yes gene_type:complete
MNTPDNQPTGQGNNTPDTQNGPPSNHAVASSSHATLDLDSDNEEVQTSIHQSMQLTQQALDMSRDTVTASALANILLQLKKQLEAANSLLAMHRNHIVHAGLHDDHYDDFDLQAMEDQ